MIEVNIHKDYDRVFTRACDDVARRVRNLAKLALWVYDNQDNIKDTFRMYAYMQHDAGEELGLPSSIRDFPPSLKCDHPCGTCACFAGHGPTAGVGIEEMATLLTNEKLRRLSPGQVWAAYVSAVFMKADSLPFFRVFGIENINCPDQAVRRTQALLKGWGEAEFKFAYRNYALDQTAWPKVDPDYLEMVGYAEFKLNVHHNDGFRCFSTMTVRCPSEGGA